MRLHRDHLLQRKRRSRADPSTLPLNKVYAPTLHRSATQGKLEDMIRTPRARKLCTKTEFSLYEGSLARAVKDLTPAEIRKRVTKARTLRNKYRSEADRQDRESRGRTTPKRTRAAKGSDKTREKQQLFQEVLDRYQEALGRGRDAKKKAPARKKASRKKTTKKATSKITKKKVRKKTVRKAAAKKGSKKKATPAKPKSRKKAASSRGKSLKRGPGKRIQRHVAARNRRRQAGRDSRGR